MKRLVILRKSLKIIHVKWIFRIEKAIAEKNPNVVYLHKVGPEGGRLQARCYKVVLGAGDDQIYYFDYHTVSKSEGDGLLDSDFKKMNKK